MRVQHPRRLLAKDSIFLIAPGFAFQKKLLLSGKKFLEKKFHIKAHYLKSIHEKFSYFAGDDERRTQELLRALTSDKNKAVFAVRGGYGCSRIYPELIYNLKKQKKNLKPKILLGYSDLTILLNALFQDLGWVTFHGPVVASRIFETPLPIEAKTLYQCLFLDEPLGRVSTRSMKVLTQGTAEGRIVGGCLSLLVTSIGTPYEIQTKNRILFIEEVAEKPYRIDRMLTQLLHAGKLKDVKGVVFGHMTNCGSTKEILSAIMLSIGNALAAQNIPILYGFPSGHGRPHITFPIGVQVLLNAKKQNPFIEFLESGVS